MPEIWIDCHIHQGHQLKAKDISGLAVTPLLLPDCTFSASLFCVTHVRSSLAIWGGFSRVDTERLMQLLLPLADWTLGEYELRGQGAKLQARVEAAIMQIEAKIKEEEDA